MPLQLNAFRLLSAGAAVVLSLCSTSTFVPASAPTSTFLLASQRAHAVDLPSIQTHKTAALLLDPNSNRLADPGDEIAYTIDITNTGPISTPALYVEDPSGFYWPLSDAIADVVSGSVTTTVGIIDPDSALYAPIARGVVVTMPSLAPSQRATISFRAKVRFGNRRDFTFLPNAASILTPLPFSGFEPITVTNLVTTPLAPLIDLAVSQSLLKFDPLSGASTFLVRYSNSGRADAHNVTLTETLPLNTEFDPTLSASGWVCMGDSCVYPAGTVTATLSPPEMEVFRTLTFTVRPGALWPSSSDTITNSVRIGSSGSVAEYELNNNLSSLAAPLGIPATYTVSKSYAFLVDPNGNSKADLGDLLRFTIRLTNTSTSRNLMGIRLADPIDSSLALAAGTVNSTRGTIEPFGVAAVIEQLPPGESVTLTFNANVASLPDMDADAIVNTATVAHSYSGAESAARVNVPVSRTRNVAASQMVEYPRPYPYVAMGDRLTFTVHLTNTGVEPPYNWVLRVGPDTPGISEFGMWCMRLDTSSLTTTVGTVAVFQPVNGQYTIAETSLGALSPGQSGIVRYSTIVEAFPQYCSNLAPYSRPALYATSYGYSQQRELLRLLNRIDVPLRGPRSTVGTQQLISARGRSTVSPGERVTITIGITNVGTVAIQSLRIFNSDYVCLTVLSDTLTTTQGAIGLIGNPPAVNADLGTLAVDASARVSFQAVVKDSPTCSAISNVGGISDASGSLASMNRVSAAIVAAVGSHRVLLPLARR